MGWNRLRCVKLSEITLSSHGKHSNSDLDDERLWAMGNWKWHSETEGILSLGFSHLQLQSHVNVLSLSGIFFPVFSIFFSPPLAVLSPWESVSGPLGESRMWLHELLKLTKAYSFPINLPWATCSSCEFPAWDVAKVLRKAGCVP